MDELGDGIGLSSRPQLYGRSLWCVPLSLGGQGSFLLCEVDQVDERSRSLSHRARCANQNTSCVGRGIMLPCPARRTARNGDNSK